MGGSRRLPECRPGALWWNCLHSMVCAPLLLVAWRLAQASPLQHSDCRWWAKPLGCKAGKPGTAENLFGPCVSDPRSRHSAGQPGHLYRAKDAPTTARQGPTMSKVVGRPSANRIPILSDQQPQQMGVRKRAARLGHRKARLWHSRPKLRIRAAVRSGGLPGGAKPG